MAKKKAYHKPRILGNVILVLVIVIALIGLYYIYQVSSGRAFMQSPRVDKVIQRIPESCCCSTQAGKLFEVTAQVLKGANEFSRVESCFSECQGPSHSTVANPSILIRPGKCASAV